MTALDAQGDLLEYLASLHEPGWVCPKCGSTFSGSEADIAPGHHEPHPPSPIPGECATQKIKLDMLLLRLSPAWKTIAWTKYQDALARILEAKQVGVDDALLGRVLADARLHNWTLVRSVLSGDPAGSDVREEGTRQLHIDRKTSGTSFGIEWKTTPDGIEVKEKNRPTCLIRWTDLPEPGGTT